MPVYEFYCPDCHTLFSFFSRRVDTHTRPACPKCGRPELGRQPSLFAISRGRGDQDAGGDAAELPPGMDEEKLMSALASMSGEFERLDEDDPKQAAQAMRKLFAATGMRLGDGMAEALRRMECGEDPEQIEADLGDLLEQEDPFSQPGQASATGADQRAGLEALRALRRELLPPARDDTWYPLAPAPAQVAPSAGPD